MEHSWCQRDSTHFCRASGERESEPYLSCCPTDLQLPELRVRAHIAEKCQVGGGRGKRRENVGTSFKGDKSLSDRFMTKFDQQPRCVLSRAIHFFPKSESNRACSLSRRPRATSEWTQLYEIGSECGLSPGPNPVDVCNDCNGAAA